MDIKGIINKLLLCIFCVIHPRISHWEHLQSWFLHHVHNELGIFWPDRNFMVILPFPCLSPLQRVMVLFIRELYFKTKS